MGAGTVQRETAKTKMADRGTPKEWSLSREQSDANMFQAAALLWSELVRSISACSQSSSA